MIYANNKCVQKTVILQLNFDKWRLIRLLRSEIFEIETYRRFIGYWTFLIWRSTFFKFWMCGQFLLTPSLILDEHMKRKQAFQYHLRTFVGLVLERFCHCCALIHQAMTMITALACLTLLPLPFYLMMTPVLLGPCSNFYWTSSLEV